MPTVRYTNPSADPAAAPVTIEVPIGTTLLDASKSAHVPHGSACGGVCACSTCHVYVTQGGELLSESEDDEMDILDKAFDVRSTSRLGCQAKIERDGLVVITLSRESRDAYYNEHPDERRALEAAKRDK